MTTLVLTVIGEDQSGLVEALAGVFTRHGGSWSRSSMARLGTKFAGIVEVSVPDQEVDDLVGELERLGTGGLLDIIVERVTTTDAVDTAEGVRWDLGLIGQDRPGIIHEIAHALARSGVSIEELQTWTSSAPMSAEIMFEASAVLVASDDVDLDQLTADLESLANELMVDIELTP
jgi:glycine cleavage system regulatory protein